MIDSHAHIEGDEFPDRGDALARAAAAGVTEIICVGSGRGVTSARRAVELAHTQPCVSAAVGIHPHDVANATDAEFEEIAQLAKDPKVVAIGETGLDYHYDHASPDAQQHAFRRFIRMADDVGKPLVVHVRDAHDDARRILDEEGAPHVGAIIHCFTGSRADADAYLERGYYLSFSGIVTFRNAQALRDIASTVPENRLLIETDSPYLAPVPLRGRRNEPAYLVHTLASIASARGCSPEALADSTSRATREAFRLFVVALPA